MVCRFSEHVLWCKLDREGNFKFPPWNSISHKIFFLGGTFHTRIHLVYQTCGTQKRLSIDIDNLFILCTNTNMLINVYIYFASSNYNISVLWRTKGIASGKWFKIRSASTQFLCGNCCSIVQHELTKKDSYIRINSLEFRVVWVHYLWS